MKEIDSENEAGQIMLQLRFTLHSDVYFMPSVLYTSTWTDPSSLVFSQIRIRIRKSFIAKYVYTCKDCVLATGASIAEYRHGADIHRNYTVVMKYSNNIRKI